MTVLREPERDELVDELVDELLGRPIEELLDEAAAASSWEDAWPWLTAAALHGPDEAFAAALARTSSTEPGDRAIGADLVGRLVEHAPALAEPALERLVEMLDGGEDDPEALAGVIGGLSWLHDQRALGPLLRFAGHADEAVRYGV